MARNHGLSVRRSIGTDIGILFLAKGASKREVRTWSNAPTFVTARDRKPPQGNVLSLNPLIRFTPELQLMPFANLGYVYIPSA